MVNIKLIIVWEQVGKNISKKSFQTFYIKQESDWTKDPQKGIDYEV